MSSTVTSPSTPAAEITLTRKEKVKLLHQMFFIPCWTEVIRLFPNTPWAFLYRGVAHDSTGRPESAIADCDRRMTK